MNVSPVFHLILLVFALCCFMFSAMQTPPSPNWNRTVALGLAFFTASFISW